ncbi:DUF2798 domain-containing protein [Pedobacter immunditicola]|uniref:DUF2798 domain-containing protein n=1 Tax=Pedobacter immunditicola TaxID=3133440 RepID=UPI0030A201D1
MKINYFKYINTFFVVAPMTLLMAFIAMVLNNGYIHEDWVRRFFSSWLIMFPIAYLSALMIIPFARKVTNRLFQV